MNLIEHPDGGISVSDELRDAPKIYAAMAAVMGACGAIGKDQKNQQQNYKFRGIDDLYNHLQTIKAEHGVFEMPEVLDERTEERESNRGGRLIYRILKIKYTFYASDGSYVSCIVIGEGMDSGDKAANKAMSVAHKYALIQAFNIRTADIDDSDKTSPGESRPAQRDRPPPQEQQGAPPPAAVRLQRFNKARAAFAAIGVEQEDMLTYINKKTIQDVTEDDLGTLFNWYQERKGAKK